MARTNCPNGHWMWNGDGGPVVEVFRIAFFREYSKEHPDTILGEFDDDRYFGIWNCVSGISGEDIDCWYCHECKGVVVFLDTDDVRYDFKRMNSPENVNIDELHDWEEYVALRDCDFDDFMDHYEGMKPLDALESYDFPYRYRLSPDKKTIYAFDSNNNVAFGYYQSEYTDLKSYRAEYSE